VPLGDLSAWEAPDGWSIAAQAVAAGVERVIVLDLARVGVGAGTGTEALCARLAATYPHLEIVAGGGVRDGTDLRRLRDRGVSAALIASALHDGRLRREDLAGL
jgi:phosphoribosylformimino-5-aminoimidazole carboxamide ribotide isomerase